MSTGEVKMPCFETGFHGFHHTVDSALEALADMDIPASRVTIRMAGRGWPSRWVVSQSPSPGAPLGPGDTISLSVAGLGYFHALPVGMWDTGGETETGTREIVELLDDPLQKTEHWIREGAKLFDISPHHLSACSRWISLFGLSPEAWPSELWYNLCLLLPNLHEVAGKKHGIQLAFQLLLGLPVREIRFFPLQQYLPRAEWTLLAERFCRLGVDCVLGNRMEDVALSVLVVGPVTLATYNSFREEGKQELIASVLRLCTLDPHRISWLVHDAAREPRLGCETENSRLGVNAYLGEIEPWAVAKEVYL